MCSSRTDCIPDDKRVLSNSDLSFIAALSALIALLRECALEELDELDNNGKRRVGLSALAAWAAAEMPSSGQPTIQWIVLVMRASSETPPTVAHSSRAAAAFEDGEQWSERDGGVVGWAAGKTSEGCPVFGKAADGPGACAVCLSAASVGALCAFPCSTAVGTTFCGSICTPALTISSMSSGAS